MLPSAVDFITSGASTAVSGNTTASREASQASEIDSEMILFRVSRALRLVKLARLLRVSRVVARLKARTRNAPQRPHRFLSSICDPHIEQGFTPLHAATGHSIRHRLMNPPTRLGHTRYPLERHAESRLHAIEYKGGAWR